MNRLTEAVAWSGRDTTLILFAAYVGVATPSVRHPTLTTRPREVRTYYLEDPEHHLTNMTCYEYDLVFSQVPQDMREIVTSWLEAVLESGAEITWFGFEGSFNFEHLLTPDVANQVFAAGTSRQVELALEDERREGQAWVATLTDLRHDVLERYSRGLSVELEVGDHMDHAW